MQSEAARNTIIKEGIKVRDFQEEADARRTNKERSEQMLRAQVEGEYKRGGR